MTELKHCPFCGAGVCFRIKKSVIGDIGKCSACGAMVPFERWNTRPIEDALRAAIAEKDAEIAKLKSTISEMIEDIHYLGG